MVSWDAGLAELVGLEDLAQADHLAPGVGHLDADRGLAGDALDEDRLGLQAEAEVFGQRGDAAIFMPASGLNSKVVTTGPGLICTTLPRTLNSSNLALMRAAMSFSSWLS